MELEEADLAPRVAHGEVRGGARRHVGALADGRDHAAAGQGKAALKGEDTADHEVELLFCKLGSCDHEDVVSQHINL